MHKAVYILREGPDRASIPLGVISLRVGSPQLLPCPKDFAMDLGIETPSANLHVIRDNEIRLLEM